MRYPFGRSVANRLERATPSPRLPPLDPASGAPSGPTAVLAPRGGSLRRPAIVLALLLLVFVGLLGPRLGTITTPSLREVDVKAAVEERPQPAASKTEEQSPAAPSSRGPREEAPPLTFEESFIRAAVGPAQASQRETRVPASVTIAQAMLESDWGRSGLSRNAHNYFGIKARPDRGPAGVVYMNTWEVIGGRDVTVKEPFRAYHSMEESFVDHGHFLADRSLYRAAFKYADDPQQFAREIHKAGYATDPNYSNKLIAYMDRYNLYQYDVK